MFSGIFKYRSMALPVAVIGLLCSLEINFLNWNTNQSFFHHMMFNDNYALAFSSLAIISALLLIMLYSFTFRHKDVHYEEVLALLIFALVGVVVLTSFTHLVMLFLGIEILSLSLYVLAGINKRDMAGNEAAIKYFLMGSFSTGFLLFGIALVYGTSASFDLTEIGTYVSANATHLPSLFYIGILLITVAMLFKVAAVPFQFWTPDVYEGSPTLITAFMATVGKTASFAAFYRLFQMAFLQAQPGWAIWLIVAAIATMLLGNITAIYQRDVKRMLAYSSIAHAGYMLLAIVAINDLSAGSLLFYSTAYSLASLLAFSALFIVQQSSDNGNAEQFDGLAKNNKLFALALTIALLSLAGIPFTAGFFGKFYIFSAALKQGYLWLVIVAVVSSIISLYYYFRPVINMYMKPGEKILNLSPSYKFILLLLAALIILLGVLPGIVSGLI
jgi:NADH-quinone oxidoreductase subunit N